MEQLTLFDMNYTTSSSLSKDNLKNPAILRNLPYDKIYEVSRKEASRKKPIFFLHKYFARRTTCNFRLMLLSLLSSTEEDVWKKFYSSGVLNEDENVTILDPFMGGGTTIFEATRLGAKVIGNDLQPLSKFVTSAEIMPIPHKKVDASLKKLEKDVGTTIKKFFTTTCPQCNEKADVMYNFHVNQARSKITNEVIDIYSSFVLSEKKDLLTLCCPECNNVFKSNKKLTSHECPQCKSIINNPRDGYVKRGKLIHPKTGESDSLRNYADGDIYPFKTRIIAQEYYCPHCRSHDYKSFNEEDYKLYTEAESVYEKQKGSLKIPFQEIPKGYNTKQMMNHGYVHFKDMFTKVQLLSLGLLLQAIENIEDEESKFWLLLAFSASLEMNNKFCRYQYNASKISNIFFNHAYVPLTMPVENNVWGTKLGTGTFIKSIGKVLRGKEFNTNIYDIFVDAEGKSSKIHSSDKVEIDIVSSFKELSSKKSLLSTKDSRDLSEIPNSSVDIILTDPPYGSNIMYSELIDFFHSWLHLSEIGKSLGFEKELSPKDEEVIVNPSRQQTYEDYSIGLKEVFLECNRVTKDSGYLVFTFHDSKLEGWLAVMHAIQESGFKLVSAYPIHSESRTGAHTSSKDSIAFDIFLICSKENKTDSAERKEDLQEISKLALKETDEILTRLESVNAEITISDIENFFISQFFVQIFKSSTDINSTNLVQFLKEFIRNLDKVVTANIVNKRTGWWSEMYGHKRQAE